MKYLTLILVYSLLIISCKKEQVTTLPITPKADSDSLLNTLLKPQITETPAIELEDKGFENVLIALGIDTDNQINGKISEKDVNETKIFGFPGLMPVGDSLFDAKYGATIKRYSIIAVYLRKKYGTELSINKLTDIAKFKNLREIYINATITTQIDSVDFSANKQLEIFRISHIQIRKINFNGCPKMKRILFPSAPHPIYIPILDKIYINECSNLEALLYNGDPRTLDVSKNTNLRYLEIVQRGDIGDSYNTPIGELNLCNNTKLEGLKVLDYKKIYLPSNVFSRYEKRTPASFSVIDWGILPSDNNNWEIYDVSKVTICQD